MEWYRSGYNGPDSKSGVPATVPWVRIPPAPPEKSTLRRAFFNEVCLAAREVMLRIVKPLRSEVPERVGAHFTLFQRNKAGVSKSVSMRRETVETIRKTSSSRLSAYTGTVRRELRSKSKSFRLDARASDLTILFRISRLKCEEGRSNHFPGFRKSGIL